MLPSREQAEGAYHVLFTELEHFQKKKKSRKAPKFDPELNSDPFGASLISA